MFNYRVCPMTPLSNEKFLNRGSESLKMESGFFNTLKVYYMFLMGYLKLFLGLRAKKTHNKVE